jgi:ABC-type sugar transport system ATPase subunit
MTLRLQGLAKRFGQRTALDGLDLDVTDQSFTVLTGPPKSGKTTLMRIMVGLEAPDEGAVLVDGRDVAGDGPARRPFGYVPQSFALYPHMTVRDNVAYPLTLARAPRAEVARAVDRAAAMLSIGHLLAKTPDQLSGGEKQRCAIARGLLRDAKVFLLDDPLVGLDYKLRERLMDELKDLRRELGATFLYATSDSVEGMTMASDVAVIDGGRIIQAGPVEEVYHRPAHARALELVGFPRANLLPATARGGWAVAGPLRAATDRDGPVLLGARPEALRLSPGTGATVRLLEDLGSDVVAYLDAEGLALTACLPAAEAGWLSEGAPVGVAAMEILVFGPDGPRLGAPA